METQDLVPRIKDEFRDGVIFIDEFALMQYTQVFVGAFVVFALSFMILDYFLLTAGKVLIPKIYERYESMDSKQRAYWLSCLNANIHHICVVPMALYGFTHSTCEGAYPFIWFFDEVCFLKPEKFFVMFAMVSTAYLVHDYLIQILIVKGNDAMAKQMHIHHMMGIVGILLGCVGGYAIPGIACMTQITELSTILINYRSMFRKEELGGLIPTFLQVTFFLVYTVVRVFLMPYGLYVINLNMYETWPYLNAIRRICVTSSAFLYLVLTMLNYYWYYLMIRRMLQVCGCIKKKSSDNFGRFEKDEE